jgi:two-component system alkaline phosphatase synthesis response regulator PhoP
LVATLLQHVGYTVTCAEDGFHALEAIVAEESDILVLDLLMPILNRSDVLDEVRTQSPRTAAIILNGAPDAKTRAQALGANAVLAKPFAINDLLGAVAAGASWSLSTSPSPASGVY